MNGSDPDRSHDMPGASDAAGQSPTPGLSESGSEGGLTPVAEFSEDEEIKPAGTSTRGKVTLDLTFTEPD